MEETARLKLKTVQENEVNKCRPVDKNKGPCKSVPVCLYFSMKNIYFLKLKMLKIWNKKLEIDSRQHCQTRQYIFKWVHAKLLVHWSQIQINSLIYKA